MTCAREGCENPLPPPNRMGRRRFYCSDDCRYDAHRPACVDVDIVALAEATPRAQVRIEQHDRGACDRCRRERWLYSPEGEARRLCSACLLRSIIAPADHEIRDISVACVAVAIAGSSAPGHPL